MQVIDASLSPQQPIEKFPYKGTMHDVVGTSISWLSAYGDDGHGIAEYGLRLFICEKGGKIPIHSHFYVQTMYILGGTVECSSHDLETDEPIETKTCGPGSAIFIPSMEPHSIRNIGDVPVHFLCCICNVYDSDTM